MALSDITKAVIAVVVGVIMLALVAVPIIGDSPVVEREYSDVEGIQARYSMLPSGSDLTVTVGDGVVNVGGDELALTSKWTIVLFTPTWKVNTDGSGAVHLTEFRNNEFVTQTLAQGDTIQAVGGVATVTASSVSHTIDYTLMGYYDNEGIYGTTSTNNASSPMPINANAGAMVVTPGQNCISYGEIVSPSEGSVSVKVYTSANLGTYYPVTFTVTEDDGVYTVSNVALAFSTPIPAYVIAPIETYVMVESDGALSDIVSIIPVLIGIGVLLMVVGAVVLRRS